MSEKKKSSSKKKKGKKEKRLTKEEKEEKERKELEKLDKELKEVDLEIKKVALKNSKVILENWDDEKEGLTSNLNLSLEDTSPSLEMVNAPQRRLVPLERTLQVETSAPSVLGNNNNNNQEFNQFKYNAGASQDDGPKYMANYAANAPGVKKVDINDPSVNLSKRKEVGFNPMYTPEAAEAGEASVFNPVKRRDLSELGGKQDSKFKKEVKYTPSGS